MPPRTLAAPILVSEARARFSELVEQVTAHPGCSVVIGHRNRPRAAVLVDAGHYEVLLAKAHAVDYPPGKQFRLAGSIQSNRTDAEIEAVLAEARREQRALSDARLREI